MTARPEIEYNLLMKLKLKRLLFALGTLAFALCLSLAAGMFAVAEETAAVDNLIYEEVNGLFADYAMFELKEGVDGAEIARLREEAEEAPDYEVRLKPVLDRAEEALAGVLKKDLSREYTTANGRLPQNGKVAEYAKNELMLKGPFTDIEPLGITAAKGREITVFAAGTDKEITLPSVAFYSEEDEKFFTYPLNSGMNSFISPGGCVYVVNPCTKQTQGGDAGIYVEGGESYPVFRGGDSEYAFSVRLAEYCERMASTDGVADVFEAVGKNAIVTASASLAEKYLSQGKNSIQKALDGLDKYMRAMLSFDGVLPENSENLRVNIRFGTPEEGGAFSADGYICVDEECVKGLLKGEVSQNFALSLGTRTIYGGGAADGMLAAFSAVYCGQEFSVGLEKYSYALTASTHGIWAEEKPYAVYAFIEGAYPGFWKKRENLYRYESAGKELNPTEREVYYCSLAAGADLSGYFERWGYFADGETEQFAYGHSSEEFKNLVEQALKDGVIQSGGKKLWYIDDRQFKLLEQNGGKLETAWAGCYDENRTVTVRDIYSYSDGYTLFLPEPSNKKAHLLYEIQGYINGVWQVLGITYTSYYEDERPYGDAIPQYRVYAYDRMLNRTGVPQTAKPLSPAQTEVCRVGDVKYGSLQQAIDAAPGGSVIELLCSFKDGGITVNKVITVMPAPEIKGSITITKNCAGAMFTVTQKFTLGSSEGAELVLDGNGFAQNGSLIEICSESYSPECSLYNVNLRNNKNLGDGGAIKVCGNARLRLFGCKIENNSAENGGGLFMEAKGAQTRAVLRAELFGLTVRGNAAKQNGGGICLNGNAVMLNYKGAGEEAAEITVSGNSAVLGGGIYSEGSFEGSNVRLYGNSAEEGGGAYVAGGRFALITSDVYGNSSAERAGGICLYGGTLIANGGSFKGDIYKGESTFIHVESSLPDFSEARFVLYEIPSYGVTLFDKLNGIPEDQFTSIMLYACKLNVLYGEARYESSSVTVGKKLAKVTFKCGENAVDTQIYCGEIILPDSYEGMEEGKYIHKLFSDGKEYSAGDKYSLEGDCVFTVEIREYFRVTLVYGINKSKFEVKQFAEYVLPSKTPEGVPVSGWECSDGKNYNCADSAEVDHDLVFTAILKPFNSVILWVEGERAEVLCAYGSTFVLPRPARVPGKCFAGWQTESGLFEAGESIVVKDDFFAGAVFVSEETRGDIEVSVTVRTPEGESTAKYNYNSGTLLTLPLAEACGEEQFCYWLIDGERFNAGAAVTVTGNLQLNAVYGRGFTVKLTQLKGGEETSESFTYGETRLFVLPRPAESSKEKIFEGWLVQDRQYPAGAVISVTEALEIKAVYRAPYKFTVTATVNPDGDPIVQEVEEGGTFILPNPLKDSIWGDKFHYWDVNGVRYATGAKLTVLEDTQIKAVYAPFYKVTLTQYVNGKQESSEHYVAEGDTFKLPAPDAAPEGLTFRGWEVDGKQYGAGERITVTENTEIKAVYVDSKGEPPEEKSNIKRYVIIGVAVAAVLAAVGVSWYFYAKKKSKGN